MFFGFWNKARNNKENIFYTIVTIFLLERVRTGCNRIAADGRKEGMSQPDVERRQRFFVVRAALLYALPFVLPVLKYVYRSIEELSWGVQGLVVFKSLWAFLAVLVLVECFLAIVIYNLLRIYVDRMNAAIGFFTKIGRNIFDGSKVAIQMSGTVGSRVVGGIRLASSTAVQGTRRVAKRSAKRVVTLGEKLASPVKRPVSGLRRLVGKRRWDAPAPTVELEEMPAGPERAVVNR